MKKNELFLLGWDYCYEKEDWYPPLRDVLHGVTAEQASWRPEGAASNTIWETVNHLTFYKERLLKRLTGEETEYPSGIGNDDTFTVKSEGEKAWQETVAHLETVHNDIRKLLSGMSDEQLERRIPKKPIENWVTSLIMHDAYHTGQIVLIRKLQGSWPSRRSFE